MAMIELTDIEIDYLIGLIYDDKKCSEWQQKQNKRTIEKLAELRAEAKHSPWGGLKIIATAAPLPERKP